MKKSLKELAEGSGLETTLTSTIKNKLDMPRGFKSIEDNKVTVDLSFLRDMNIFFATPCYGGVVTDQYFLSMFRLSQALMQHGIKFRITTLRNESLITRARNILTAMFLEDTSSTHLMFIDADIEFEPDSVIRMLAMDKDIIAGAYPKKTVNWGNVLSAAKAGVENISTYGADYAINLKFDAATKKVRTHMGAVEVLDASTGFFIVKREVINQMIKKYPDLHYKNDSSIDPKFNEHCYALWDTEIDPIDRRYLSEDYAFCRRWQRMGGEIWVDPNTKLNHVGSFTFEGNLSNVLQRVP
jgi:GT2 family glycosyltransferase